VRSKAIAERAAWDFMAAEGGDLELSTINPAGIFGPVLGADASSSIQLITRLMRGMPGCPRLYFGVVDVRDVANLHLRAMTHPAAKGERFIAVSGAIMSMLDIARVLKARLGKTAQRVPTRQLPNWLVRIVALFDPTVRAMLPLLDNTPRDEREGRAPTRMATKVPRGRDHRNRREPHQIRDGRSLTRTIPLRSRLWFPTSQESSRDRPL